MAFHFIPSPPKHLVRFSNADYASCLNDRRSIGGHYVHYGDNLVSWSSKKHHIVSRSSPESEFRSLANVVSEIIWLDALCAELGLSISSPHQL